MDTKTQKLNELFGRWKQRKGPESINFAEDGIIDESSWNNAPRKVMFLLKDTNNSTGDFREKVKAGPWPTIGSWGYGLQRVTLDSIPSFTEARSNIEVGCLSSSICNVKKIAGGSAAMEEELNNAINEDKDLIKEQIDIIEPEIIVCCATFHHLKSIYDNLDLKPLDPDKKCFEYENKVWIDYCHPSARFRHDMMYYTLMSFYRNSLK